MYVYWEDGLKPCRKCGANVMMATESMKYFPAPKIWCPECETIWVPKIDMKAIVKDWWNNGEKEARAFQ